MMDATEIAELQGAILKLHGAQTEDLESVPVRDTFQWQTVWDGVVEVFDLTGHATAGRAHAWSHQVHNGGRRFVAVLHVPPVDTPLKAVRAALVAELRARSR